MRARARTRSDGDARGARPARRMVIYSFAIHHRTPTTVFAGKRPGRLSAFRDHHPVGKRPRRWILRPFRVRHWLAPSTTCRRRRRRRACTTGGEPNEAGFSRLRGSRRPVGNNGTSENCRRPIRQSSVFTRAIVARVCPFNVTRRINQKKTNLAKSVPNITLFAPSITRYVSFIINTKLSLSLLTISFRAPARTHTHTHWRRNRLKCVERNIKDDGRPGDTCVVLRIFINPAARIILFVYTLITSAPLTEPAGAI